jgi:hypothetical protein
MRRRRSQPNQSPRHAVHGGPLLVVRAHPAAWAAATRIAAGDHRRLHVLPNGSVIVENSPDWRKHHPR